MAGPRWLFQDPVELDSYSFAINPNQGGTPPLRKQMEFENTAAPDGKVLAFEGRDEVKHMEVSGVLLTEDQYDAMVDWFGRRHQVNITDDLGRLFSIYITGFEAERQRAIHHPWKHSWTMRYTIVDWVT